MRKKFGNGGEQDKQKWLDHAARKRWDWAGPRKFLPVAVSYKHLFIVDVSLFRNHWS